MPKLWRITLLVEANEDATQEDIEEFVHDLLLREQDRRLEKAKAENERLRAEIAIAQARNAEADAAARMIASAALRYEMDKEEGMP